jgi:hypothetical protein
LELHRISTIAIQAQTGVGSFELHTHAATNLVGTPVEFGCNPIAMLNEPIINSPHL